MLTRLPPEANLFHHYSGACCRESDSPLELADPLRPAGDRLPPADANILEALDDALTAKGDVVAVPKWTFDYARRLIERLRRPLVGAAVILLSVASSGSALTASFTPPDPALSICQLMIGVAVVARDVIAIAVPCSTDPTNLCATINLTLGPGHYPFQLVCSTGEITRSNIKRIDVP